MSDIPDDSDSRALQMMARQGIDMESPVRFEFSIHTEDEPRSKIVMERLKAQGVGEDWEIVFDEGELDEGEEATEENRDFWPSWTVYVCQTMKPNHADVVEFQRKLVDVCGDFGVPEGWTIEV